MAYQQSFHRIEEGQMVPITLEEVSQGGQVVGFMGIEGLRQSSAALGVDMSVINEMAADSNRLRNSVDIYDTWSVGLINIVNLADLDADRDQLLFIVMANAFLLVQLEDKDNSVRAMFDAVVQRFQKGGTLEKFVFGMLERFIAGGGKTMEELDASMLRLEERVVSGQVDKSMNRTIYNLRQKVMLMRNLYEQLIDIGEELGENENEVFNPHNLHYFAIFVGKAERLSNAAQLKSENLVHLREALDAELDYTLNNIMKLFTVLTAIFAPLTLIVGWYGMNFGHMPELNHPWAYPAVFLLCVVITVVILWVLKRKRLM